MAHDALTAHSRDELGISDLTTARPIQAAFASAATFAVGAALPLATALVTSSSTLIPVVIVSSILFLALLGGFGAYAGGAPVAKATMRVTFWGALAMALTAGVVHCLASPLENAGGTARSAANTKLKSISAVQPHFDQLSQDNVAHERERQQRPVQRWKRA